ncbi:MAG: 6-carboxytetrahydropterin synthase [Acidobacteriota bacterium]|nr:6-carboxytetrahydropterin synthase [Acidobacteriota bacterium]
MLITRKIEFSASHALRNPELSDVENTAIFGSAANPHGHGHNYSVEVTLSGNPDPATGMVMDLKELKEVLHREILEPFDHRFLNHEVPPFDRVIPTAENIAIEIWRRLRPNLGQLHAVRVWETADLYVDYFGEGEDRR